MDEIKILDLAKEIRKIVERKGIALVAIDGCGGSGKSTLAEVLRDHMNGEATIVHKDEFYLPSKQREAKTDENEIGSYFDWSRLLHQVIMPIRNGMEGYYQKYNWEKDELSEWERVPKASAIIIEGVYSLRKELFNYYDYTVWVETPYTTRLLRGVQRDGEHMRHMWEDVWMPAEQQYVEKEKPNSRATLIIDGLSRCD